MPLAQHFVYSQFSTISDSLDRYTYNNSEPVKIY